MTKPPSESAPATLRESLEAAQQRSLHRATGSMFRPMIIEAMADVVGAATVRWLVQLRDDDPDLTLDDLIRQLGEGA